jgi:predicted nucleic acid-binding protein
MVDGKHCLFVDTSGWIEVFKKHKLPRTHNKAREMWNRVLVEACPIITTNYVITEFIGRGGKACNLNREELLNAVDKILKFPTIEVVHIGEYNHAAAITFLRGYLDKEWSLVDATSFNVMRQRGIVEAFATDYDFVQAGFKKLLDPD